jgi:hypothetical protein
MKYTAVVLSLVALVAAVHHTDADTPSTVARDTAAANNANGVLGERRIRHHHQTQNYTHATSGAAESMRLDTVLMMAGLVCAGAGVIQDIL